MLQPLFRELKHVFKLLSIAVVALVATVAIHFRTDAKTRAALAALRDEAQTVVLATQAASGNDRIDWQTAPGQIIAPLHTHTPDPMTTGRASWFCIRSRPYRNMLCPPVSTWHRWPKNVSAPIVILP